MEVVVVVVVVFVVVAVVVVVFVFCILEVIFQQRFNWNRSDN